MKAITASALGPFDDVLSLSDAVARPQLDPKSSGVLLRVLACSISPGDMRRVRGDLNMPAAWPHGPLPIVVGMDVCGVVIEAGALATFKVGDVVAACDGGFVGGMAEYAVVDSAVAQLKPSNVSAIEAATLVTSALRAKLIVELAGVVRDQRVLVIGASGGLGVFLVQLLRDSGVAYQAAISTQDDLLRSLGVDLVLPNATEWWAWPAFEAEPLDVIFDCVGGEGQWARAQAGRVLKRRGDNGRFVGVMGMNDPNPVVNGIGDMIRLMAPMVYRMVATKMPCQSTPHYVTVLLDGKSPCGALADLFALVEAGKLKVVLDPASPFPFTTEGARAAYHLQASRHAHGKVVVQIADE